MKEQAASYARLGRGLSGWTRTPSSRVAQIDSPSPHPCRSIRPSPRYPSTSTSVPLDPCRAGPSP
eukprot:scaffold9399_cov143-Isochrysis_galbana.AAC.2